MTPLLLIAGIVGLILGIVHVCPSVLTGLGWVARFTPVASRIALRDLSNRQLMIR